MANDKEKKRAKMNAMQGKRNLPFTLIAATDVKNRPVSA